MYHNTVPRIRVPDWQDILVLSSDDPLLFSGCHHLRDDCTKEKAGRLPGNCTGFIQTNMITLKQEIIGKLVHHPHNTIFIISQAFISYRNPVLMGLRIMEGGQKQGKIEYMDVYRYL